MSEIEQARDALKKWRSGPMYEAILSGRTLVPIVDGTAGNPDLLEAIDGFLAFEEKSERVYGMMPNSFATIIAAAIVAAEERMQQ